MKTLKWLWATELQDLAIAICLLRLAILDAESGRTAGAALLLFLAIAVVAIAKRPDAPKTEQTKR